MSLSVEQKLSLRRLHLATLEAPPNAPFDSTPRLETNYLPSISQQKVF
jgi:hypothetical protein